MTGFTGGDTADNNRKVRAASYAGDNQGSEGATELRLSQQARQDIPDIVQQGAVRLQSGVEDGCYPFGPPTGEPALGIEDTDEDEHRDNVPTPNPTGTIPTATNAGDSGAGFFNGTAPQKFPQFPKDPPARTALTPEEVKLT